MSKAVLRFFQSKKALQIETENWPFSIEPPLSARERERGKKEEKGKVKESLRKYETKTEKERKKEQKEGTEKRC